MMDGKILRFYVTSNIMPYDPSKKMIQLNPETRRKLKILKAEMDLKSYDSVIEELIERRQLVLGHYKNHHDRWFVSWGNNVDEIIDYIEHEIGHVEKDSITHMKGKGYFSLLATYGMKEKKMGPPTPAVGCDYDRDNGFDIDDDEAYHWMIDINEDIEKDTKKKKKFLF